MTEIRKGQAPAVLSRQLFHQRFMQSFMDPAFRAEEEAISRVEAIAWEAYQEGRKAPFTRKAGAPAMPTPITSSQSNGWKPEAAWNRPRQSGKTRPPHRACW